METFLFQATIYLSAAVIAVPLASRFGLGSVLGYLLAGVIIGPMLGLVGSETRDLQHFAEFGVVMMLFLVGLELEPRTLWDMRHRLIGLGGLQILLTTVAVTGITLWLGEPFNMALAIGLTFSLSSTAIVLQTLSEKGLMQSPGGRSAFSVLLTQDIAVIPMLALVPLLAMPGLNSAHGADHGADHGAEVAMSLVEGLPGWGVTLVTLGAVGAVILMGVFLTRPLFHYVHMAKLRELYVAVSLAIVVGIAILMIMVGLSPALGTFLAGVVLANSEFRHELESDIEPFKGLLLGLFFITVGAGIDFNMLLAAPVAIVGLTLGVMTVKGAVLFVIGRAFGLKGRDQWLFALGLAQAGEFGFVMLSFTVQQDILPTALADRLLLIVALSMLLTPLLFILYEKLAHKVLQGSDTPQHDEIDQQGTVIVAGVGRFGQIVNRLVTASGFQTVVLDHDLETVNLLKRFGFKTFFGDPTRPDMLHAAGLRDAAALVITVDDPDAAMKILKIAKAERPDMPVIVRARDRVNVYELYQAGARDIVRESFDSSVRAGRYTLQALGLSEYEARAQADIFWEMDRHALADLAQYWKPGVALDNNPEFVERAKELARDLDVALMNQLGEMRAPPPEDDAATDDADGTTQGA